MMNVIALWILFSTLGAGNVMFPDQSLVKTSAGEQQHLEEAKGAAIEPLRNVLETARQTGEGFRERVLSASKIPRRTADAVQHFGADVAQVVKDGSQSGLEKIGLARTEERQSREKMSYNEKIKEDALNAYDRTKDAAGDTLEATGDKVKQAGFAAKDKITDTAWSAKEKVSEGVDLVGDSASGISESLQDNFNAAEGKASEIAGSAYEHTTGILKESAEQRDQTNIDTGILSYKEKIKRVSEQAADIVRNKATEAASVLPNVGQGLAYRTKEDIDEMKIVSDSTNNAERIAAEGKKESRPGFLGELIEGVKGVQHAAGSFYNCAKDQLSNSASAVQSCTWKEQIVNKGSNSLSEAEETVRKTKDAAVDIARDNAGKIIDRTHHTEYDLDPQFSDRKVENAPKFLDTCDNLTQTTADAAYALKNRTFARFQKLKGIAAAYLLSACKIAHIFTLSTVYGSSLWVTFISGYFLARSIPRQQFGFVQSRIFPAYLRLAGSGQAVCLVCFLILHPWSKDGDEKLQHLDLLAVLVSTLANVFYLEPRATKAMFQKLKTEKEEGRGQDGFTGSEDDETKARMAKIDNRFRTFHGYSSVANLLSLMGMTWHLWHLSSRMVV